MRMPLGTDLKTRTGAPDKDARLKNAYVEVKNGESYVRKRLIAQGGVSIGTGTAQGGIGFSFGGTDYIYTVNGDVTATNTSSLGTTWSAGTAYLIGDHVTVGFVDYWAIDDNTGNNPTTSPTHWSTSFIPPIAGASSWRYTTTAPSFPGGDASNMAWNGSIYVFLQANPITGFYAPYTSTDGLNWTVHPDTPINFGVTGMFAIAWNGTIFCAIGDIGTGADTIYSYTSTNGITWTEHTQAAPVAGGNVWDIVWNGTIFCAVGGIGSRISTDGITWTENIIDPIGFTQFYSVTWNGSVFCAAEYTVGTTIATSSDGITWTLGTLPYSTRWVAIKSLGSIICVTGQNRAAASSDNGLTWTGTIFSSFTCQGLTSNFTQFLAVNVGSNTIVYKTSTDGISWTDRTLPTPPAPWISAFYGDRFVIVGQEFPSTIIFATSSTGL